MSKRFDDKIVWITGGSAGIGRALAVEFARRGADVAVSARRLDRLEETVDAIEAEGRTGLAVVCDVTVEEEVEDAVRTVVDELGQLDVAIANAGFSVSGRIADLSAEEWRRQLDVNVVGAAVTARHAIPELRKTAGRVALVGSVSGMIAVPNVGAYHASKYAVRAIGQVLAMELELEDSGVTCTTLHPGFVESEIAKVDNEQQVREDWEDRRPAQFMWETEKAARVMTDAIYRRKREYTFTGHGKAAAFIGRHAPGLVHFAVTNFGAGYDRQPSE